MEGFMSKPSLGWVISPSARSSEGAKTLHKNNDFFIRQLKGKFDILWVEDHFQWDHYPVIECWTALAYYAARYPDFRFGPLVFGQSYRNPALIAKMFASLHWLTDGRLIAGIGAGWKKDEYLSYGWSYPPASERIAQLDEAVQIIRLMWSQSPASFEGAYYSIREAYCEPRPIPIPPLLIAGGGEKLTLRVVAKYADWMNVGFCDAHTYKRKLDALKTHCHDVGRDYDDIKKTYYGFFSIKPEKTEPVHRDDLYLIQGTPPEIVKELKEFLALGVEHIMIKFIDFPSTNGLDLFLNDVYPNL
jgi:alkanesulfonate monooxygenase SsuD/methylene tetrahydromethanopterin reductase-like flavin-dependent oxidoreductase (luciferase family)